MDVSKHSSTSYKVDQEKYNQNYDRIYSSKKKNMTDEVTPEVKDEEQVIEIVEESPNLPEAGETTLPEVVEVEQEIVTPTPSAE